MNTNEILISKKYLLGEVARWAVNQSPYYVPENLEIVLRKLSDLLPTYEFNYGIGGFKVIKIEEFHKWLFNIITQIPELVAWNEPKSKHGRSWISCSMFDKPLPDDDIVDLDALINNVKLEMIKQTNECR